MILANSSAQHPARYGAAGAFVGIALLVNFLLPESTPVNRFFLFIAAVLGSATYGGFVPGLLATLVTAALGSHFFGIPVAGGRPFDPANIQRLLFFLTEGVVISAVGEMTRHTPSTRARSAAFRYGVAAAATIAVAGFKMIAFPSIAARLPFAFCFALVVLSAWSLGFGPALLSAVASAMAGYFFMVRVDSSPAADRAMVFVLEATLVSLLAASFRSIFLRTDDYLGHLFAQSPAGILVLRPDLRVLAANPAMCHMLSADSRRLERVALADILHPSSRDGVIAMFRRHDPDNSPRVIAHDVRFANGDKHLWTELQAAPIEVPGERARGWLAIVEDVTEREESERLLRETETRLQRSQKLEALGLLAGSVAHDFNNQLAIILGYSEELLFERSTDDLVRNSATQISRASQRAAEFTRQLLNFARTETRTSQPINLNAIVGECKPFFARLLGANIELRTELDPQLTPVNADLGQIEQILLNLVVNARDAMPKGGAVLIRTANRTFADRIAAADGMMPPGSYAAVTVADSGVGIEPEVLERIFEPFFTTKARERGTGLGLATVRRNAKQLGGNILVASVPGKGTEMTVCFPAAKAAAPGVIVRPPARASIPPTPSANVMVVEDEDSLRAFVARVLTSAGYRVLQAPQGEAAASAAAALDGALNVLITDLCLPGLHGIEVARNLRKSNPNLQVLYMSGDPSQTERDPQTPFLPKPFTPEQLLRAVEKLIPLRQDVAT